MEKTAENSEAEEQNDSVSLSDALSKGLSSMLSSVLRDFDSSAQLTLKSQTHLSEALDRLTQELDQLLDDAPAPFTMHYAAKISSVRKRVSSLNSVLKSIQRRLDNMDRVLSINEKAAAQECCEDQS